MMKCCRQKKVVYELYFLFTFIVLTQPKNIDRYQETALRLYREKPFYVQMIKIREEVGLAKTRYIF